MNIEHPTYFVKITLNFEHFYGFLLSVVWLKTGHFRGVYQSNNGASEGAFLFSFGYVTYLNIASHFYGKQIKSNMGNKLYL